MKFIFICEFNKLTGLGHFNRCLNFANILKKNKHECIFLTFNSDKKLIKTFDIDFNFFEIPKKLLIKKNVLEFVNFISKINPDFLIFDNYKVDFKFFKELDSFNLKTIIIADFPKQKYFSDILINPNSKKKFINEKKKSYSLSGLNYQFIDKEYFEKAKFSETKTSLIYLGSIRNIDFIENIILRLNKIFDEKLKFKIILKDKSKNKFKYKNIKILSFLNKKKLIDEIDKSKFIISAGGTFLPKCLVRKKIILVIKTANNQNELIEYLIKKKLIISINKYLDNLNKKKFFFSYNKIKNNKYINTIDFNNNKTYKDFLLKLKIIKKRRIYLVKKHKSHLNEIFDIQTQGDVRKYAIKNKSITLQEHKKWFKKMLSLNLYHHFLIKKNFSTLGLVSYKPSNEGFVISIIIKKKFQNKNYAYNAIKSSLIYPEIANKKIIAMVKKDNINSIKLFKKLDFSLNNKKKLFMKLI